MKKQEKTNKLYKQTELLIMTTMIQITNVDYFFDQLIIHQNELYKFML